MATRTCSPARGPPGASTAAASFRSRTDVALTCRSYHRARRRVGQASKRFGVLGPAGPERREHVAREEARERPPPTPARERREHLDVAAPDAVEGRDADRARRRVRPHVGEEALQAPVHDAAAVRQPARLLTTPHDLEPACGERIGLGGDDAVEDAVKTASRHACQESLSRRPAGPPPRSAMRLVLRGREERPQRGGTLRGDAALLLPAGLVGGLAGFVEAPERLRLEPLRRL